MYRVGKINETPIHMNDMFQGYFTLDDVPYVFLKSNQHDGHWFCLHLNGRQALPDEVDHICGTLIHEDFIEWESALEEHFLIAFSDWQESTDDSVTVCQVCSCISRTEDCLKVNGIITCSHCRTDTEESEDWCETSGRPAHMRDEDWD
jgi:hypothetical protein